ncbi:MAG: branched-chain amino acid ABC transporter permease [Halofilum sp. (in: g-proteobacteria)]|nr:branched-chain amino acid ABC transporter permease [Halofilum sp. (in: g-proteobacteria)]
MELVNFGVYMLTMVGIYGLLALSLNLQLGFTGLINFGQVMFFAIGAYTSGLLTVEFNVPIPIAMVAAMLVTGAVGMLISLPTRSLKADYWAISTLVAAETVRLIAINEEWLTGGTFGLMSIPQPLEALVGRAAYPLVFLALTLVLLAIVYVLINFITDSPFGRDLRGVRDDEDLCLALGKNTRKLKVQSMFLAGMIAGLGGAMFAHYITFISPENFRPIETFLIWAMIIVGGRGNHKGAILGAVIVQTLNVSTRFLSGAFDVSSAFMGSARMALIGLLIIVFLLYRPEGLLRERKKLYD